jgi:hypothetical protein
MAMGFGVPVMVPRMVPARKVVQAMALKMVVVQAMALKMAAVQAMALKMVAVHMVLITPPKMGVAGLVLTVIQNMAVPTMATFLTTILTAAKFWTRNRASFLAVMTAFQFAAMV